MNRRRNVVRRVLLDEGVVGVRRVRLRVVAAVALVDEGRRRVVHEGPAGEQLMKVT